MKSTDTKYDAPKLYYRLCAIRVDTSRLVVCIYEQGCVWSTGTRTILLDLPVREGLLLQYGSPIRTRNLNPNTDPDPKLILMLAQYIHIRGQVTHVFETQIRMKPNTLH